jgi:hypothetical protein
MGESKDPAKKNNLACRSGFAKNDTGDNEKASYHEARKQNGHRVVNEDTVIHSHPSTERDQQV